MWHSTLTHPPLLLISINALLIINNVITSTLPCIIIFIINNYNRKDGSAFLGRRLSKQIAIVADLQQPLRATRQRSSVAGVDRGVHKGVDRGHLLQQQEDRHPGQGQHLPQTHLRQVLWTQLLLHRLFHHSRKNQRDLPQTQNIHQPFLSGTAGAEPTAVQLDRHRKRSAKWV